MLGCGPGLQHRAQEAVKEGAHVDSAVEAELCAQDDPVAFVQMATTTGGSVGAVTHSTCEGADLMTSTQVFHSTVTAPGDPGFGIQTSISIKIGASIETPASGTHRQTLDASETGLVVVNVLTPGVTFTSDSGYAYAAPVPEPASPWLMAGGLAALAGRRRLQRRKVGSPIPAASNPPSTASIWPLT